MFYKFTVETSTLRNNLCFETTMISEDATYPGLILSFSLNCYDIYPKLKILNLETVNERLGGEHVYLRVCRFTGIIVIRLFFLSTQHFKPNHDLFGREQPLKLI